MQKRPIIALFCRKLQNFERNERDEFWSYKDAKGTEFAQFFLKFSKKLSIFRPDHFRGQINIHLHIAEMGKIIYGSYGLYWGITTEIQKIIFQAFPLVDLFKTTKVSQCATPSQRVWSHSMCKCLGDSLYIGRCGAPIAVLAQKPPRIDFFSNFFKTLKATREANVGRIRAFGVRNLLSFFWSLRQNYQFFDTTILEAKFIYIRI